MVAYATRHGIKAACRTYEIARNTVRKWVRRAKEDEPLTNRSTRPANSPNAMIPYWRLKIIDEATKERARLIRYRAPNTKKKIVISASWLKQKWKIPYSLSTILSLLHREGLKITRPQKVRKALSPVVFQRKQLLPPGARIMVDVKYLTDIHGYAPLIQRLGLPSYQLTARDVRTGALFMALSSQNTQTATAIFVDELCAHFSHHGIDCTEIMFQTDNGREFTNAYGDAHASAFSILAMLKWGATHRLIPLGQKNWQSDVESAHRLNEDELWMHLLPPPSTQALLREVQRYNSFFNLTRYNSYKGGSPLQKLREAHTSIDEGLLHWSVFECDRAMTRDRLEAYKTLFQRAREECFYQKVRLSMRVPPFLPPLPQVYPEVA